MREPSVFSVGPLTGSPPSRGRRTRSIVPAYAGTERLFRSDPSLGPRLRGDDEPGPSFPRTREPSDFLGRTRHWVPAFAGTTNPLRRSRARGNRASFARTRPEAQ